MTFVDNSKINNITINLKILETDGNYSDFPYIQYLTRKFFNNINLQQVSKFKIVELKCVAVDDILIWSIILNNWSIEFFNVYKTFRSSWNHQKAIKSRCSSRRCCNIFLCFAWGINILNDYLSFDLIYAISTLGSTTFH